MLENKETIMDVVQTFIEIAKTKPEKAKELMKEYKQLLQKHNPTKTKEEINKAAESNIGYMLGYFDYNTRNLVYKTFNLEHPIFKNI